MVDAAEPWVLERENLPAVAMHPAPWQLGGSAWIIILRLPEALRTAASSQVVASLRGEGVSGMAFLMYVDYERADCGPYRELLFSPGSVRVGGGGRRPTISRIVVSSYESVVNGRANWGIPKDQADFAVETQGAHTTISVSHRETPLARLQLSAHGPAVPLRAGVLPRSLRTVVQHWAGQEFRIALAGSGHARFARVHRLEFPSDYFPDLSTATVVAATQLKDFQMTFPCADVTSL